MKLCRVKIKCDECGNEIVRCPSLLRNKHNFCNVKCKCLWQQKHESPKKGKKYKPLTELHKQRIREGNLGKLKPKPIGFKNSGNFVEGHTTWNKGMTGSNSHMYGNSSGMLGKCAWNKGLTKETDTRVNKISETQKNRTLFPEVNKSIILKSGKKPNYMEDIITNKIDSLFPDEFIYSGDGKVRIGGKIPDWFNVNGKKQVIEFFGRRWHKPEDEPKKIEHYKKFGFGCLVIWSEEIKNMDGLKSKLINFHDGEVI